MQQDPKKQCTQCGQIKDRINDFYWSNGISRRICKDCVKQNEKEKYQKKMEEINNFKKTLRCKKCGEKRFYLLDFHHRNPEEKDFQISDRSRASFKTLKKEIEKCDVLCSNCHREYHYLSQHEENLDYNIWLESNVLLK